MPKRRAWQYVDLIIRSSTMRLSAFPVPSDLQPWICAIVAARIDSPTSAYGHSRFPALVGGSFAVILEGAVELWEPRACRWASLPAAFLTGPQTSPFESRHLGPLAFLSMFLRPSAITSLLGDAAIHAVDRIIGGAELWGPRWSAAEERLRHVRSDTDRAKLLAAFLRGATSRQHAVEHLRRADRFQATAHLSVTGAAYQLGLSPRQYQRRFADEFGMAPKLFQRIQRIESALGEALNTGRTDSNLALGHGYYDQAHLARDLRMLVGQPITKLLEEIDSPQTPYWPLRFARRRDLAGPSPAGLAA